MRFSKNLGASFVLLALAMILSSFTYTAEENCEEVVTKFRAVSKDGGAGSSQGQNSFGPTGNNESYCPTDFVGLVWQVIISDAYEIEDEPANCGRTIHLYAHLAGNFLDMVGLSPTISFSPYGDDFLIATLVPSRIDLSDYESQICSNSINEEEVDIRIVLVYYDDTDQTFHELTNCDTYFPLSLFELNSTELVETIDVDCGCGNDTLPGPEPTNPDGKDTKPGNGGIFIPGLGPSPADSHIDPLQHLTTYTDIITANSQPSLPVEKLAEREFETAKLYPNPFQGVVNLQFDSQKESKLPYTVYDAKGKAVMRNFINTQKGSHSYALPLAELPGGLYWVQIQIAGEMRSFKTLKM